MHARHKSLVFFPFTCHLFLLPEALQGFVRFLGVLEVFGMVWKALALEGFGKLLKSLGGLWEAVA